MDTHYLVNVVHNSFKEASAIFEPFLSKPFSPKNSNPGTPSST